MKFSNIFNYYIAFKMEFLKKLNEEKKSITENNLINYNRI